MAKIVNVVKDASTIILGQHNENKVREVRINILEWLERYGNGSVVLLHKRSQDSAYYPVNVTISGDCVSWLVTNTDTAYPGSGRAEVRFYSSDGVMDVSKIWETIVMTSATSDVLPDAPEAEQSWVDKVAQASAEAILAAQKAEEAAERAENAGGGEGGVGTQDHNELENRDMPNQHPIAAITALEETLQEIRDDIVEVDDSEEAMTNDDVSQIWDNVIGE